MGLERRVIKSSQETTARGVEQRLRGQGLPADEAKKRAVVAASVTERDDMPERATRQYTTTGVRTVSNDRQRPLGNLKTR